MSDPDWPAIMPGVDDDPTGARGHAATLLDAAGKDLAAARVDLSAGELPAPVRTLAGEVLSDVGSVRAHVHRAAGRLDALAVDDLIPEKGRERLTRETKAATAAALREVDARTATNLDLLEAGLTAAAQPAFPEGADRGEARQELLMLLAAADDPATAIRQIAGGSDERLAALAAGTFGTTYLRSRGVDERTIQNTAVFVAQGALTSTDPRRRAAATALARLPELRKARLKALQAANFAIGWGD